MLSVKHYPTHHELALDTAQHIYECIKSKLSQGGHFVLGLATGASPQATYRRLIELLSVSHLDLSDFHTVNLDEYYPMMQTDGNSFFQEVYHTFWQPLHDGNSTFPLTNGHILNGEKDAKEECARYEKLIADLGGIDLQILGLGPNGHIGFNEPGSPAESKTRKVTLDSETRNLLKDKFETVPEYGLTMGIANILAACEIVMIATGEKKTPVFQKLVQLSQPEAIIPASYLLNHKNTIVFTDLPTHSN